MSTKMKIKAEDNSELRAELDALYENTSQINLAKWSLLLAKHILESVHVDFNSFDAIAIILFIGFTDLINMQL